ncbi:MAG: RNA 2',3'-cyclic phosphodiesterase [Nitrospinota bacterium]|nr:RNA 2',3'-cyclic phosphodiesterase [Nitrospinota bacterium]
MPEMIKYAMDTVRAFVAVKAGKEAEAALGGVLAELAKTGADVRWVHAENLHLTLKFLGNVKSERIGKITETVEKIARETGPISLAVNGLELIPNPHYPRIVCAELGGEVDKLKDLAELAEKELVKLGFEEEQREFFPHITLGRVKSFKAKSSLIMKMRQFHKRGLAKIDVKQIFLMKSELNPTGAIYTELAEMKLSAGGEK